MNFIKNNFFQIITIILSILILFIQYSQNKKMKKLELIEQIKINDLKAIISNILNKYDKITSRTGNNEILKKASLDLVLYLRDIRASLLIVASQETLDYYQTLRSINENETNHFLPYFKKFMGSLIKDIRFKNNDDEDLITKIILNLPDSEYEKFNAQNL